MALFDKHFNLYLPTGWEVSQYPVLFPFTAEFLVYDMTLFTVGNKKFTIRHNFLYVNNVDISAVMKITPLMFDRPEKLRINYSVKLT